ncbi:sigma-70 family RNA polymerase sigma factor [Euzebya tangerina]|uniref:sigma-70 family RNA polymerase sigma factor n=1 Tax=Euzebya tangerina TaxID=591198 RepID=UPI000E31318B|nr:sigma-70 family RNA polymerase sigma factor [Euzebya tangerina]
MSPPVREATGRLRTDELHEVVLRHQREHDERDSALVMTQIDPLIRSRVRKVLRPSVEFDDLYQVARLAAVGAMKRWRPDGGASFTTFATRSMDGAMKRYFRDRTWDVHVTRSAKNLSLRVTRFTRFFETDHGREPSILELADYSGMTEEEIGIGMEAASAYSSDSLNVRLGGDGAEIGSLIPDGSTDGRDREDLIDILAEIRALPDRERRIVFLSYFQDLTQREIAERVGCSQMHVSRLLRRSLSTVRENLVA